MGLSYRKPWYISNLTKYCSCLNRTNLKPLDEGVCVAAMFWYIVLGDTDRLPTQSFKCEDVSAIQATSQWTQLEHKTGTENSLWQWAMLLWRHRVHKDSVWRWFSGPDLDYDFRDKNTWQTGARKRTEGESGISSRPKLTCERGRCYFNQAEVIVDRQSKTVFSNLNLVMLFHGEFTRQLSPSEFIHRDKLEFRRCTVVFWLSFLILLAILLL